MSFSDLGTSTQWMLSFNGNEIQLLGYAILIAFFLALLFAWIKNITL